MNTYSYARPLSRTGELKMPRADDQVRRLRDSVAVRHLQAKPPSASLDMMPVDTLPATTTIIFAFVQQ
jgi:hypothetical protein